MKPGQDLAMVGLTDSAGTYRTGARKEGELGAHFSSIFLNCLGQTEGSCVRQWMKHELPQKDCAVTTHKYTGEGGVSAALWSLPGVFNAGIDVDLKAPSIRQVTMEVCELYEPDPYRLPYGDCVIVISDRGGQLVRRLKATGIPGTATGYMTGGIVRQICHGEETVGYLERPRPDELLKITDSYAVQH